MCFAASALQCLAYRLKTLLIYLAKFKYLRKIFKFPCCNQKNAASLTFFKSMLTKPEDLLFLEGLSLKKYVLIAFMANFLCNLWQFEFLALVCNTLWQNVRLMFGNSTQQKHDHFLK